MRFAKRFVLLSTLALSAAAFAGRTERQLVDWTVDGEKVTVPHTWNVKDGSDGPGKMSSHVEDDWLWGHNSVWGVGYARTLEIGGAELLPPPAVQPTQIFSRCFLSAMATASVLLAAPSFEKRATRWVFTLGMLMPSCLEMSLLVRPRVSEARMSC